MTDLRAVAETSKAWPFEEARKLVKRFAKTPPAKGYALFETGYGPSGLPHIGTFGEVARTSMVRAAFETLTEGRIATRLISFSDDMDGLRKVPPNLPNQDMLAAHLHQPLTAVPDPFGEYDRYRPGAGPSRGVRSSRHSGVTTRGPLGSTRCLGRMNGGAFCPGPWPPCAEPSSPQGRLKKENKELSREATVPARWHAP